MRPALRSLSGVQRSLPRLRSLVVASALVGVVALPSAGAAPTAAQAMAGPSTLSFAAVAMDPDSPDADGVGDGAAAPDSETTAQAPAGSDGLIHLRLVPGDNELRFVLSVRTFGQATRQSACATRAVTGDLVLTPGGAVVSEQSKFVADLRPLHCAAPLRDGNAQVLLDTQNHPTAEIDFEQTPGLSVPLPTGDAVFQMVGQQSVHGVTRHAEYATTATFSTHDVTGHASTDEKLTNFNIKPPQIGPLLQVEDAMTIEFDFHATIGN